MNNNQIQTKIQIQTQKTKKEKLSIVIPVYNEKNTVEKLLDVLINIDLGSLAREIIIVDDCSTDGTRDILKKIENTELKIFYKDKNEGKGSAVITGLKESTGDYVIIQDADLEYDPNEYESLLAPLLEEKCDVVYGSRFTGNGPHRVLYYWHYLGNKALTTFSNMMTNMNLTDMETCYKVFNRKAVDSIKDKLSSKRFGIEPEITALISKNKLIVYEVGISYFGRTYEEGKKIGWRDGFAALYYIIKYNLFSRK